MLALDPLDAQRQIIALDKDVRRAYRDAQAGQIELSLRRGADPAYAPVYEAVREWRDRSLATGMSVFQPDVLAWNLDAANELHRRFIEGADEGDGSFFDKLEEQMRGASQAAALLMAELLYVHLLPLTNVTLATKQKNIALVGSWAPEPFDVPPDMVDTLGLGIFNGGAGFNTGRPHHLRFLIRFVQRWAALDDSERAEHLDDPWKFKELLYELPLDRAMSQRNALLLILFPDHFEDISAREHKRRIVEAFKDDAGPSNDIDRQLLAIRAARSEEFGQDFSWYRSDIRPTWDKKKTKPTASTATGVSANGRRAWIIRVKRDDTGSDAEGSLERGDTRIFWPIDVPAKSSLETIKDALRIHDPDLSNHSLGNQAGSIHRFITRVSPADLVLMPDGGDLYVGTVTGDAEYQAVEQEWRRPVDWLPEPVARDEVSPALYSRLRSLLTITEITELSAELEAYLHSCRNRQRQRIFRSKRPKGLWRFWWIRDRAFKSHGTDHQLSQFSYIGYRARAEPRWITRCRETVHGYSYARAVTRTRPLSSHHSGCEGSRNQRLSLTLVRIAFSANRCVVVQTQHPIADPPPLQRIDPRASAAVVGRPWHKITSRRSCGRMRL